MLTGLFILGENSVVVLFILLFLLSMLTLNGTLILWKFCLNVGSACLSALIRGCYYMIFSLGSLAGLRFERRLVNSDCTLMRLDLTAFPSMDGQFRYDVISALSFSGSTKCLSGLLWSLRSES